MRYSRETATKRAIAERFLGRIGGVSVAGRGILRVFGRRLTAELMEEIREAAKPHDVQFVESFGAVANRDPTENELEA